MPELSALSDTLYVPLLGRIYASKYHPDILNDEAALSLWDQLPKVVQEMPFQTEYTQLASAVRSLNMDHYIKAFLAKNPKGSIIDLGCGLESLYERNDNGQAQWFELDLPEVLAERRKFFPPQERDHYLPYSMFDDQWIEEVLKISTQPVFIAAAGLFIYFQEEQVIEVIEQLSRFKQAQLVFDTVSALGIKISRSYVKKMGKQEATMYFSVGDPKTLMNRLPKTVKSIESQPYYRLVPRHSTITFPTRMKMAFSDVFNMVKMINIQIENR
jgi:O-methyltransferase involved in polyketide biosynthesis